MAENTNTFGVGTNINTDLDDLSVDLSTNNVVEEKDFSQPIAKNFDVRGAYNFLVNDYVNPVSGAKGMSANKAEETIARRLTKDAGLTENDFINLKAQGKTSGDIISMFTGLRNPSQFGAFAEGVNREGLRQTPAMALAFKGAQAGFKAPLPLPLKILTSVAGGVGGYIVGLLGGKSVEEMVLPSEGVVPSKYPPLEAGRSVGGLFAGVPTTTAAARALPEIIDFGSQKLLKNIATINGRDKTLKEKALQKTGKVLEFFEGGLKATRNVAINNPKTFVAGESVFAVPIGTGAYFAEQTAPGEILPRLGAEIGFSFLFPQKLLANLTPIISENISPILNYVKTLNVDDVKTDITIKSAKRYFDNVAEALEGDPENYVENLINVLQNTTLRDADGEIIKLTPSQVTGDKALALFENYFLRSNSKYGIQAKEAAAKGLNKISYLLKSLNDLGTPDSLKLAAQVRENLLQSMFKQRLDSLGIKAAELAEKSGQLGKEDIVDINLKIKELVTEALQDWRKIEKAAYREVDKKQIAGTSNLEKTWEDITENEIIKGVTFVDPTITRFIAMYTDAIQDVTPELTPKDALLQLEKAITLKNAPIEAKLKSILDESGSEILNKFNEKVKEGSVDELNQINTLIQGLLKNKTSKDALFPDLDSSLRNNLKRYAIARKKIIENRQNITKKQTKTETPPSKQDEKPETTLKDLMLFRSLLLDRHRDLIAQGRSFEARHFGRFAEAALDDMGVLQKRIDEKVEQGIELSPNEKALSNAFSISRLGNDIFTRTFAGDIGRVSRTGANKVPPEFLAEKLFAGSSDATLYKYDELEKAMELISKESKDGQIIDLLKTVDDPDGISFPQINENIEARKSNFRSSIQDIVRIMSKKVLQEVPIAPGSKETMLVPDPKKVEKFFNDNEGLFRLDLLKDLKDDLTNSVNARALFNAVIDKESAIYKSSESVKLLQKLINGDNPHETISQILSSPYKVESNFNRIVNILNRVEAKDSALGQQAKNGLRTTIIDWALDKSKSEINGLEYFDPRKLNKILNETKKGRPSILNMMKNAGIVDNTYIEKFDDLTKALDNIVTSLKTSGEITDILADPNGIKNMIASVGGVTAGSFLNKVLPIGGTIQIPGYGAKLARNFFVAGPKIAVGDAIEQTLAPGNNSIFAAILEEGLKIPASKKTRKDFNAEELKKFFYRIFGAPSATVLPVLREFSSEVIPSEPIDEPAPSEIRQVRPPVRETRPPVRETSPQVMAPPPSAPKTDMASRTRFQQLFPMDIASQTMTQTAQAPVAPPPMRSGIGSLV